MKTGRKISILNYRQNGFTLAELLIALAILGVIATFTIPKILDSGSDAQRISTMKENVATLYEVLQKGMLEGNLSQATNTAEYQSYFINNHNALKICSTNVTAEGCCTSGFTLPGFRLPNGSCTGFGGVANGMTTGRAGYLYTDWNGSAPPNADGQNRLTLCLSFGDGLFDNGGSSWGNIRRGEIKACDNHPVSVTLFQEVFSQ